MAFNGNSLGKDEATGFLEPKKNYSLTGFDAPKKQLWLTTFGETANMKVASKLVGVDNQTLYNHLSVDVEFQKAFREVLQGMENELSGSMFDRGKKGSFIHAIAWLRAHFPAKWGNKSTIEHKSDGKKVEGMLNGIDSADIIDVSPVTEPGQGKDPI